MTFTQKIRSELMGMCAPANKKRGFVRQCFIAGGVVSNPQSTYHMQFFLDAERAKKLRDVLRGFGLHPKKVARGVHFVVYIKDSNEICDALKIMGAHKALLAIEQMRVEKSVRNSVNRKVNFEAANLNKTVSAALQTIDDIEYIESCAGLGVLPEPIKQVAVLRLENADYSLAQIGALASPPLTKSGVSHRLRKIRHIAQNLKANANL